MNCYFWIDKFFLQNETNITILNLKNITDEIVYQVHGE